MIEEVVLTQRLLEALLENRKFNAPAGYFDAIHRVINAYRMHATTMPEAHFEGVTALSSHPVRNMAVGLTPIQVLLSSLGVTDRVAMAARVTEMLADPDMPFDRTIAFLIDQVKSVRQLVEGEHPAISSASQRGALQNTGALYNILGPHRFYLLGQPTFVVEQALCEGLLQTQFGMDTPSHYLRAPLGLCFIEFGDKRDLDVFVHNKQSGQHQVEGCYISEQPYNPKMQSMLFDFLEQRQAVSRDSGHLRYIELEFVGSPLGKENLLDDATFNISLFVDDDAQLTVEQIYELHIAFYTQQHGNPELFRSVLMDKDTAAGLKPLLELLIKCLIFINSDLSTRQTILDKKELEKQLAALKNPAKKRKLQRKVNAARNYILISSKAPLEYVAAGNGQNRSVSTHWRRGHFRNQRHGEGNALVKIKWIQPTLVGVGSAQVKTYKVKE